MSEPLDETYFNWLCSKVMYDEPSRTVDLMRILHSTEYVWIIAGDQNRAADGRSLRDTFLRELQISYIPGWDPLGCSVLEMLIAFAIRAEFQTDLAVKDWFWLMMQNLGLDEYRRVGAADVPLIREKLHIFVFRLYDERGQGGLWPRNHLLKDQRGEEVWYQFFGYLEEQNLM